MRAQSSNEGTSHSTTSIARLSPGPAPPGPLGGPALDRVPVASPPVDRAPSRGPLAPPRICPRPLGRDVGRDDAVPGVGQALADLGADAANPAGHERDSRMAR